MEETRLGWAPRLQQQSCSGALLPQIVRRKVHLGWWVGELIPSCVAGGKGAREQQAMDGEAELVEGPFLLRQPQAIHGTAADSLFHLPPAETLMDSTTATAELGWTVHPPSGVSYPVALRGSRAWFGVSCCS